MKVAAVKIAEAEQKVADALEREKELNLRFKDAHARTKRALPVAHSTRNPCRDPLAPNASCYSNELPGEDHRFAAM